MNRLRKLNYMIEKSLVFIENPSELEHGVIYHGIKIAMLHREAWKALEVIF